MTFMTGMPCLIEFDDLGSNIDKCAALGLELLELNMNLPYCQPGVLSGNFLREISQQSGIALSLHLPEKLDLADIQDDIRDGHIACACRAMRWAGEAGIDRAVMHLSSGVYFSLPDGRRYIYDQQGRQFIERLVDGFSQLMAEAKAAAVTLCIENCGNWDQPFMADAISMLLDTFVELKLCWDVGHEAVSGFADESFIMANQNRVGHMHLHDVAGRRAHLELFTGCVDVAAKLDFARRNDIAAVIEVKTATALEASVKNLPCNELKDNK